MVFVVVVARHEDKFLLVQDAHHGQSWYRPAGHVEAGESFVAAAKREVLEEAGITVEIEGALRIEHRPGPENARLRIVLSATSLPDQVPKSEPDGESLEAAWVL